MDFVNIKDLFGVKNNALIGEKADEYIRVNKLCNELDDYRKHLKSQVIPALRKNKSKSIVGELGILHLSNGSQKRISAELARETLSAKMYDSIVAETSFESVRVSGAPKAEKWPWNGGGK